MIEEEARETLRKLTWRVKVARGTVAEAHPRMGVVAEEIVGLADELDAGLIVVGSRGRGRIRRTLAGSVSESVFRHAHCPVMVVETLFREDPIGEGTRVTFNWYVRVTNPALNLLGYAAERVYRHSHDSVMSEGESGPRDYCERENRA